MLNFFGHSGHAHEATPAFLDTVYGEMFVNTAPFVLLALALLVMQRLRTKLSVRLAIVLPYLLAVGLLGYNIAPIASIISLVAGFGLSLAVAIFGLKLKKV